MAVTSKEPSLQTQAMLQALQRAVTECLEKKRRLGQYAVIWQDGQVVRTGGEDQTVQVDVDTLSVAETMRQATAQRGSRDLPQKP